MRCTPQVRSARASFPNGQHVQIDALEWVHGFTTERPRDSIDDLTPAFVESFTTLQQRTHADRLSHETEPPETQGRSTL